MRSPLHNPLVAPLCAHGATDQCVEPYGVSGLYQASLLDEGFADAVHSTSEEAAFSAEPEARLCCAPVRPSAKKEAFLLPRRERG